MDSKDGSKLISHNDLIAELTTKHQAQMNQLKAVIDNVPGDIYWKDTEGVWLGVNRIGLESLINMGFVQSEKDVIGKTDYEIFDKLTADEYRKNDLKVMNTGIENTNEEMAILPNGNTIIQLSTKRPLRDENGQIVGIVGNTVDISHLKKIEAELRVAKEIAEQVTSIKMDFIRNMEHDIRTPLTGAWGISKYLFEEEKDNSERKELLGDIASCIKELLNFCNTIINYSRMDSATVPVLHKAVNIPLLMKKLRDTELMTAKYKKLELTMECDKDVPSEVIGDEYRLHRILLNLISNAIKFTHSGSVSVNVKKVKKTKEGILLQFVVKDTGIGIPLEKQNSIFEIFSRINPSNQGKYAGLGLGLEIVKRYTHELEGEIALESKMGKGSTFTCTIPFKLPHHHA